MISTLSIGSSNATVDSFAASRIAIAPAVWKAMSDESTEWALPSTKRHPKINQGITSKHALRQLAADALLHRRNELPGNRTAHHALGELEAGTAFQRLDLHHADRVLAVPAGLLDKPALRCDVTV